MIKTFKKILLTVIGNFIGILLASLLLSKFHITGLGILVSVLLFTLAQLVLSPIVGKLTSKYAPSLNSLIALITTYLALLLTSIFTTGLKVDGIFTWITASVLIWLLTVVLSVVLPKVIFKEKKK